MHASEAIGPLAAKEVTIFRPFTLKIQEILHWTIRQNGRRVKELGWNRKKGWLPHL
jgi:hypothetical protein